MILFIHGFASCGVGLKSRILIAHFGADQVLTPDLPPSPRAAIAQLRRLLDKHPVDLLIGSSLGGYYATCLNRTEPIATVLINPAVRAAELLADHLGPHRRWCDGTGFEFTAAHLAELARLQRDRLSERERYLVLLQTGDEILDYRRAARFYAGRKVRLIAGGSHRFERLDRHLSEIEQFRNQTFPAHAG